MSSRLLFIAVCAGAFISGNTQAQLCNYESTLESTPSSSFTFQYDTNSQIASAIHANTGLEWQRCSIGQTWDVNQQTCIGTANKLNWQAALQAANSSGGWRLPNIKELVSILDVQCTAPPFNNTVFPNTPSAMQRGYWSSTPFRMDGPVNGVGANIKAWYVETTFGQVFSKDISDPQFVRLVR
ncbi:MAG: DUF1566 domain-containing protein [Gammaproteobacteria bacterium]|nr:DUF1566 domain-containing protein [Gammaproteobacteria bacterium]MDH5732102.1 DUF1566 domain-containing protein [Gammaproteobacteria bacterium]